MRGSQWLAPPGGGAKLAEVRGMGLGAGVTTGGLLGTVLGRGVGWVPGPDGNRSIGGVVGSEG